MARTYAHARGRGPTPKILEAAYAVRQYGAAAVFGRVLTIEEMRKMILAERIVEAYQARAKSDNWAEWASQNQDAANLLNAAMIEAEHG